MSISFEEQVLINARFLLSDKSAWYKKWTAADKNGKPLNLSSAAAVKFCLLGATHKSAGELLGSKATPGRAGRIGRSLRNYLDNIVQIGVESGELSVSQTTQRYYLSCVGFNDSKKTTHKDALRLLDLAIEMLPTTPTK